MLLSTKKPPNLFLYNFYMYIYYMNKYISNLLLLSLVLSITYFHKEIQNKVEKMIFQKYYDNKNFRRPRHICAGDNTLDCFGFPSGHAETITIFSLLMYFYKLFPLWFAIIIILLVSYQRIYTYSHNILQVIVGIIFGILYAVLYKQSLYYFVGIFVLGIILYHYMFKSLSI